MSGVGRPGQGHPQQERILWLPWRARPLKSSSAGSPCRERWHRQWGCLPDGHAAELPMGEVQVHVDGALDGIFCLSTALVAGCALRNGGTEDPTHTGWVPPSRPLSVALVHGFVPSLLPHQVACPKGTQFGSRVGGKRSGHFLPPSAHAVCAPRWHHTHCPFPVDWVW